MKNLKLITILLLSIFISCDTQEIEAKNVKSILMAKPWYFFSINEGEAYDCVKQTKMTFLDGGELKIDNYVRMPDYTCGGPYLYNYRYELLDNDTKIEWEGELYTIEKLTDTEFVKTREIDGKKHVWVYKR